MARMLRAAVAACLLPAAAPALPPVPAAISRAMPRPLDRLNRELAGRVLDFTNNHGADRRIWSAALGQRRNVYVYLPPGYDGATPLPAALWLHGMGQDEKSFFEVVRLFDGAVRTGRLPPLVIAAPDGSIPGPPSLTRTGSFYVNSAAGRYADYVVQDVWHGLVRGRFCVRPDRDGHVLSGASMGGFGAYSLGLSHKAEFAHLIGIMPPLDLTYGDCRGDYLGPFDPLCRGERVDLPRDAVVGRFGYGLVRVRSRRLTDPLLGRAADPAAIGAFTRTVNPAHLVDAADVRPGEFGLFAGYGGRDEFNAGATVLSFAERCRRRGFEPDIVVVPDGRHNFATAVALFPPACDWLRARLAGDTTPVVTPP